MLEDAGLVMRNYWWPGISKYVLSYVDGCDVHMSEGEIISRDACREAYAESNPKCALDGYFCGLYYRTT